MIVKVEIKKLINIYDKYLDDYHRHLEYAKESNFTNVSRIFY